MDFYHDIEDVNKKHHPLVDGRIIYNQASNMIQTGLAAMVVALGVFTVKFAANMSMSLFFLLLYFGFGHAYNDGLGKSTIHSYLPISLSFTSLGLYGWFLSHSELNLFGYLLIAYIFCTILFQIAWSGNLKDMDADEVNLLRKLGATDIMADWHTKAGVQLSGRAQLVGLVMKGMNYVLAFLMILANPLFFTFPFVSFGAVIALFIMLSFFTYNLVRRRMTQSRDIMLIQMSMIEIASIYIMLFITVDAIVALALAVYGVTYFFLVNKKIWKFIAPKV